MTKQDRDDEAEPVSTVERTGNLTSWKPGQTGNKKGRPRGSRGTLVSGLIDALNAHFDIYGDVAVHRLYHENVEGYLKIVAKLAPTKMEATLTQVSLSAEFEDAASFAEAMKVLRRAKEMVGSDMPLLELEAERRDAELFSDD